MSDIQTTVHYEEDEISLLDILVTLAESWRLLVFGPILAGLLAGGMSLSWPASYESVAIVRLPDEDIAILHAESVLNPLVEKFGYLQKAGGNKNSARLALKKDLTFVADRNTKLVTITVKADSQEGAQALGRAALTLLLQELSPKGADKDLLLQTIEVNNKSIADNTDALDSLKKNAARFMGNDVLLDSTMRQFAGITSEISRLRLINLGLGQQLRPRGSEVYVQEPSFPETQTAPKRVQFVLLVALTVGFGLLLFVFARKAWQSLKQDPESLSKIMLIKKSFRKSA